MKRLLPLFAVILACGTVAAAQRMHAPRPLIPDRELAGSVRSALHARLGRAAGPIDVEAQNGFVFLYGEVQSDRFRARADSIASGVAGVRGVSNELLLAPGRAAQARPPVVGGNP